MVAPLWKQIHAAVAMNCQFFVVGHNLALISILLPSLRRPDSKICLDMEQESWIVATPSLAILLAQLVCGALTGPLGRKHLICAAFAPLLACQLLIHFATDFTMLVWAMFLHGIGVGVPIGPLFIAEVASPKYRCSLISSKAVSCCTATLVAHILGCFFNWRTIAIIGLVPVTVGLVTSLTTKESPAWLASKGRYDECTNIYTWFRGPDEEEELRKMIHSQKVQKTIQNQIKGHALRRWFKFITDKGFLKGMSIALACDVFANLSGKQIFTPFLLDLIKKITGGTDKVFYYAIGFDLCDTLAAGVACYLLTRVQLRIVLFRCAVPALILILIFCTLSFSFSRGWLPAEYSWLTFAVVTVYFVVLHGGVVPLILTLLPEVFPLAQRGIGVCTGGVIYCIVMFFNNKFTPSLLARFDIHGTFLINASIMSVALLYMYYYIPETNKKTLVDIEKEMRGDDGWDDLIASENFNLTKKHEIISTVDNS